MSKKKKHREEIKETLDEAVDFTKEAAEEVGKKSKSFFKDFKSFIAKGNIVDLAVAVVIGTAFNKIVSALVNNIIMPLTGRLIASQNVASLKWVLVESVEADEEAGIEAVEEVAVTYGVFLQAIIDFLIVSLCIFIALKIMMKVKETAQRRERRIAAEKAKEEEAKRAAEEAERKRIAEEEAARLEQIKKDFIEDVAIQADVLNDIKVIMLRMEERMNKAENNL